MQYLRFKCLQEMCLVELGVIGRVHRHSISHDRHIHILALTLPNRPSLSASLHQATRQDTAIIIIGIFP